METRSRNKWEDIMGFLPLGRLSVRLADEKGRSEYIQPFNLKNRKLFENLYLEPFWIELGNVGYSVLAHPGCGPTYTILRELTEDQVHFFAGNKYKNTERQFLKPNNLGNELENLIMWMIRKNELFNKKIIGPKKSPYKLKESYVKNRTDVLFKESNQFVLHGIGKEEILDFKNCTEMYFAQKVD